MDPVNVLIWGIGVFVGGAAALSATCVVLVGRKKEKTPAKDEAAMRRVYFDTHRHYKRLVDAGIPEAHAIAITESTHQAIRETMLRFGFARK